MKKILVVLMILAVAGGVFAQQGEWSYQGSVEIGTRMDFNPGSYDPLVGWGSLGTGVFTKDLNTDGDQTAKINGQPWNTWDAIRGRLDVKYARDPFDITFGFNTKNDFGATLNFSGDNFKAQAGVSNLLAVIAGNAGGQWFDDNDWNLKAPASANGGVWQGNGISSAVSRLWGSFDMFQGVFNLTVAYRSDGGDGYWVSDLNGAFMKDNLGNSQADPAIYDAKGSDFPSVGGHAFTKRDGHQFVRANLTFTGLEFGLLLPNVFPDGKNGVPKDYSPEDGTYGYQLVDDVLLKSVLGIKFNMDPIEFAAQFKMEDYGAYFGGKFNIGLVKLGLSFMGILDPAIATDRRIKLGGGVEYNADLFGAGIQASLDNKGDSGNYSQVISITPNFSYKVIPSNLLFRVDTGFYMAKLAAGSTEENEFFWAIQPALFWNFRGTGAGDYSGNGYAWGGPGSGRTGIMARYRVVSNMANLMDVVFNWQF